MGVGPLPAMLNTNVEMCSLFFFFSNVLQGVAFFFF